MRTTVTVVIMTASCVLILFAMLSSAPYEAKIYAAVTGIIGMIVSVLLAIVEDYWR